MASSQGSGRKSPPAPVKVHYFKKRASRPQRELAPGRDGGRIALELEEGLGDRQLARLRHRVRHVIKLRSIVDRPEKARQIVEERVVAPAHAAGVVDIVVVTKSGKSRKVTGDRFTYQAAVVAPPLPSPVTPPPAPVSAG